MQKYFYNF